MNDETSAAQGEVGRNVPRLEIREKVTGRAQYIADLSRPNMLYGAILQSPFPHARIKGYKVEAALSEPGVHAVLTGQDIGAERSGPFIKDEWVLAKDKVRYVGEPVALVAAEDEPTARKAARLIEIDYEELPSVLTPDEALAEDAPIIHENNADYVRICPVAVGGNVAWYTSFEEGDVDSAWDDCDVVVEGTYETPAQAHVAIEPCGR